MVRIRVVVVTWDFSIVSRAIQIQCLAEGFIGIEAARTHPALFRHSLQLRQQSTAYAEPAGPLRNPRAFDLADTGFQRAQGTVAHRLSEEPRDEHATARRPEVLEHARAIFRTVEAA